MAVLSWSPPFFPPQKRRITVFLRTINIGISTPPPSLVPLGRRNTPSSISAPDDDGTPSWICPAASPQSMGLACPVLLYGAQTIPPMRSDRCSNRNTPSTTRRRHHSSGSGPNRRRSLRRQRRHNSPQVLTVPSIFARPKRLRRLLDRTSTSHHTSPKINSDTPAFLPACDDAPTETTDPGIVQTLADETPHNIDWNDNSATHTSPASPSLISTRSTTRPPVPLTRTKEKRKFVISTILTQNAHGLRRRARDINGNIIPNSPFDYTRYEHLIATMKQNDIDVYFIQETWLEGNAFDKTITGYHVFRHNGEVGNHAFRGVAIVLSPRYYEGWKTAGAKSPITTDATGEFTGRFISLNIQLANNDHTGKQIRGKRDNHHLTLTLISVYHPCTKTGDDDTYLRFLDTLDDLLNQVPATSSIVMGADVNSNIGKLDGVTSAEFQSVLGPHGFSRRNTKGESLLHVYLGHRLRVMNTFLNQKMAALGMELGQAIAPRTRESLTATCSTSSYAPQHYTNGRATATPLLMVSIATIVPPPSPSISHPSNSKQNHP